MSRKGSSHGCLHCLTTSLRGLAVLVSEPVQSSPKSKQLIPTSDQAHNDKAEESDARDELRRSLSRATTCATLDELPGEDDSFCISHTMLRAVNAARGMNNGETITSLSGE